MLSPRAHELLAAAAKEPKRRIRDDREKASPRLKPLLAKMEAELLDPSEDAASLMKACKITDRTFTSAFRRELGPGPASYLKKRRLETSARLLADTDMKVWMVGDLVFDEDGKAFSNRFKRWAGVSPTAYRKAACPSEPGKGTLEHDLRTFARVVADGGDADELTRGQRRRLAKHLLSFDEPPTPLALDGADFERGMALVLWEQLRPLPPEEQLERVREPYGLKTVALFDVLREKSREEGRKDRQEGVRIAEIAIASLEGVAQYLTPDDLANKRARGYAWLGNAQRLALDSPGARRCFRKARAALPKKLDPQALAEICTLEGELYLFQSRLEKALKLKDQAVELFRLLGNNESLAEALVSRATTIGQARGWESAIPDLVAALELLNSRSEPYLTLATHHNLISAYALSGHHAEAAERLPEVQALCDCVADPLLVHYLKWTEGFVLKAQGDYEGAQKHVLNAQRGFASLGELSLVAATDLELAELALELRQPSEALSHARRAIPIFEGLENHPDAIAALALLTSAAAENEIHLEVLYEIRGYLQRLVQIPIGLQSRRAGLPGPLPTSTSTNRRG